MTGKISVRSAAAALLAAPIICIGALAAAAPPALAMQVLEAADHAELAAEIPARGVSRIALAGDRVRRVVRAPAGFAVEHDPRSGDLYLRPGGGEDADRKPVTLFIGTERGFTYRLTLTPTDRGPAQILIRNADALPAAGEADAGDPRVAALVRLVRAVARREPLAGYAIEAGTGRSMGGLSLIETWRGPRFAAHVLDAGALASGPAGLAGTIGAGAGRVAAVWLAQPGTGPSGGRLAVAVTEAVGDPR